MREIKFKAVMKSEEITNIIINEFHEELKLIFDIQ